MTDAMLSAYVECARGLNHTALAYRKMARDIPHRRHHFLAEADRLKATAADYMTLAWNEKLFRTAHELERAA